MYGYELLKSLRDDYEGVWTPQTGAVYPALRRLQEHGLLTVENVDGKDQYSISKNGLAWLDETLATMTSGVLFMARNMEIIGRAYLSRKGEVNEFIPLDEKPPEIRLNEFKVIRETMLSNIRIIDMQIEELEREVRD